MDSFPFRFLTPFPFRSSRPLCNSAWLILAPVESPYPTLGSTRWSLTCSDILTGRRRRLPSKNDIVAEKRCWGDPRGYVPLVAGQFLASEKGRQRVAREQASVGRGKAEHFPLQGGSVRLNLQWSLHPSMNAGHPFLMLILPMRNEGPPNKKNGAF